MTVPTFVTHYYLAGRAPYRSLSDVSDAEVAPILDELNGLAQAGRSHRRFGPKYMALRRATERRLYDGFVAAGGKPLRDCPHCFVLGESAWFRGLYVDAAELRVPLAALPEDATSFTYPDSVVAMGLLSDYGIGVTRMPYHGHVFRLDRLSDVIERYGLPPRNRRTDTPATSEDPASISSKSRCGVTCR